MTTTPPGRQRIAGDPRPIIVLGPHRTATTEYRWRLIAYRATAALTARDERRPHLQLVRADRLTDDRR